PGDLVNVYLDVPLLTPPDGFTPQGGSQNSPAASTFLPYSTPHAELLLTNVRVLDVSTEVAPFVGQVQATSATAASATNRVATQNLTLLLAVSAIDAEKLV